jgi:hypothetical protein
LRRHLSASLLEPRYQRLDGQDERPLTFAGAFVATLTWIWNLRITYPHLEIYVCDDDITKAFRQIKYPPNLAGLHCKIASGVMFVDTGQTFGDNTSPSNFEAVPNCRSQHAQALWHRPDTIARALPLLPAIAHQDPPTVAEAASFVQANRDSLNPGALDAFGNRRPPRTVTTSTTAFMPTFPSTSFVPFAPKPLLYTKSSDSPTDVKSAL